MYEAYHITELLKFHLVGEHSDQGSSEPAPGSAQNPQPRSDSPSHGGHPPLALHEPELVDLHPAVLRSLERFDQVTATCFFFIAF